MEKYTQKQIDLFAELLATGHTPEGAVFLMRLRRADALRLMDILRRELGAQAC